MDSSESKEEIAAAIARRKIASAGLKRIHRLLGMFDANDRANRRIAVIGISILSVCFIVAALKVTLFDGEVKPDYVVTGKIQQLKIDGGIDDPGNRNYSALVKLETGEVVRADISWMIYSLFEQDQIVEVGYFGAAEGNKYEILIGRKPDAP